MKKISWVYIKYMYNDENQELLYSVDIYWNKQFNNNLYLHRKNAPAVIRFCGKHYEKIHEYFVEKSKMRRSDGKATSIFCRDNIIYKEHWEVGLYYMKVFHRLFSPAIIYYNYAQENVWYIHGKNVTSEVKEWLNNKKIVTNILEIPDEYKAEFKLIFH